jgi:hypothetical protein
MKKRDANGRPDNDIVAEGVTQMMEYIELPVMSGPEWEMATPADDLEDAPIFIDAGARMIPETEAVGTIDAAEDFELFTETELDLKGRLSKVEDEQLELAAGIGVERARWQKLVAGLRADMSERNRLLAERDREIEDLSTRLAMLAVERENFSQELRELQRAVGRTESGAEPRAPSPADGAIESPRADRGLLVKSIAERDEAIEQLRLKLREAEAQKQNRVEQDALASMAEIVDLEMQADKALAAPGLKAGYLQRELIVQDMRQAPQRGAATVPAGGARVRHYLIGLDLVGSVYEITLPRINIGRTRENDLRIVDPTVSRLHAVLKLREGDVTVIDANSSNGVLVNGIQLRYAKLVDGDTLTFGSVRFRYRVGSDGASGKFGLD